MTKNVFLYRLSKELGGLPDEDIESLMDFYGEIIDDIIESGVSEEDAVAALGSAEEVAASIRAQSSAEERGGSPDDPAKENPPAYALPTAAKHVEHSGDTEDFKDILIDALDSDVRIVLSESGKIEVECPPDTETDRYVTSVESGTIKIKQTKVKNLHDHFRGAGISKLFVTGEDFSEIKVSLPAREFGKLAVRALSGDITVERGTSFENAEINTLSGDVEISSSIRGELVAKSVSGDVAAENISARVISLMSTSGDIALSSAAGAKEVSSLTSSGDIELNDVSSGSITCKSSSGDVTLCRVIAEGDVICTTMSGDINVVESDASRLKLKAKSGDVCGTLLTPKLFITNTVSGDVSASSEPSDSECEVSTVSGDISLKIAVK